MKKSVIAIIAVMVAGVVSADLAVSWNNSGIGVQDDTAAFVEGGQIQLIWSPVGAITVAGDYALNLSAVKGDSDGAGGFVLKTDVTGGFGLWGPFDAEVYTSADIGGADVNTGFFFSRVIENNAIGLQYFVDTGVTAGADWVYASTDPLSVFKGNLIDGNPGDVVLTTANNTTVIPEPATFGLMGIAGLGLFLARKKARR